MNTSTSAKSGMSPVTERILNYAGRRLLVVQELEGEFDFRDGLDQKNLSQEIDDLKQEIEQIANVEQVLDSLKASVRDRQKVVEKNADRLLMAMAAKYGSDSPKCKVVRDVRKSPMRGERKPKVAPSEPQVETATQA
jgi:hypothetical protein